MPCAWTKNGFFTHQTHRLIMLFITLSSLMKSYLSAENFLRFSILHTLVYFIYTPSPQVSGNKKKTPTTLFRSLSHLLFLPFQSSPTAFLYFFLRLFFFFSFTHKFLLPPFSLRRTLRRSSKEGLRKGREWKKYVLGWTEGHERVEEWPDLQLDRGTERGGLEEWDEAKERDRVG